MAQQTEAACLLQTGALYTRRLGLRPAPDADLVFAGFKHGAFSLYFGDGPIYHFDLEGRWQRAYADGLHYLKGLDASAVAIDRVREAGQMVLRRRSLAFAEASDLDATIRAAALDLVEGLASGRIETVTPPEAVGPIPRAELLDMLDRVASWDAAAWFAQRERYLATYAPFGFLPPEAQQAVVLQATLSQAGFGSIAAGPPEIRSAAEFAQHVARVADLMGRRVLQCRSIFLGDEHVPHLPVDRIAADFEAVARVFPIDPASARRRLTEQPDDVPRLEGIDLFVAAPAPPLPDLEGWRHLRQKGLRRVIMGVESGDPGVRGRYGKTWDDAALVALVSDLKQAGLPVSVVLLVGAGGADRATEHAAASAELVLRLPLVAGDIVYLVQAEDVAGAGDVPALAGQAASAQQEGLLASLADLRKERKVKVVPYSAEKQRT